MNVAELLDQTVRIAPQSTAFIDGRAGRECLRSFAAFDIESRKVARLLAEAGLQAGDGVVLMVPMSADLYLVIVAAWRMGLVPVFIDPSAGEEHFAHCIARYPVRAFVGTASGCLLRLTSPALRRIPAVFTTASFFPGARALRTAHTLSPYAETFSCSTDTPAMLAFTSGSTGRPKGMMRTHGLLQAMHSVLSTHLRPAVGEITLATMPLFTLTYLAAGATSLIPDVDLRHPGRIDPARLVKQITQWKVSSGAVSPALLERLVDYCLLHGLTLDTIRKLFIGGAPVFPRLLDKLQRAAPQCEATVLYGSTEAEPMALISRADIDAGDIEQTLQGRGLLVGKPIPEISLRILHDRWGNARGMESAQALAQETAAPGESGEIVVAGAHVAPGYLDKADEREIKFRVENEIWHRTGDAGRLDEHGRLWLLGRCAARIDDASGILYPYTVEAALSSHPAIARSALLLHAEKRVLVVEMVPGKMSDIPALLAQLSWAHIGVVVQVEKIPVDARHNAKVDYRKLRQLLHEKRWLRHIEVHE